MRRIADTTLGNPLFALEIGRALAARRSRPAGRSRCRTRSRTCSASVSPPCRTRSGAPCWRWSWAATCAQDELSAVADAEDALNAGLLRAEAGRVRPTHPLLGAAARKHARSRERRDLHLALAGAVAGEERRARHLALAARQPDAGLADTVARRRGRRRRAWRRGGGGGAGRARAEADARGAARALRAPARARAQARDGGRAAARGRSCSRPSSKACRPAGPRVRAWLLLANGSAVATYHDRRAHLERALAKAGADPALRAHALASMALSTAAEGVEQIGEVEASSGRRRRWRRAPGPGSSGSPCARLAGGAA